MSKPCFKPGTTVTVAGELSGRNNSKRVTGVLYDKSLNANVEWERLYNTLWGMGYVAWG